MNRFLISILLFVRFFLPQHVLSQVENDSILNPAFASQEKGKVYQVACHDVLSTPKNPIGEIDKKCTVGAINEESGVNPNGSSFVKVKLDIPDSPLKFQPDLSLCYNSFSSNGSLGWGWNLAGVSKISRISKCFYYDGYSASLDLNDVNNAFELDGVRLIKKNATADSINFESAYGQVHVIGYLSGNKISYFVTRYPNGCISYFRESSGNSYLLSEAIDAKGLRMFYTYEQYNGEKLLSTIFYNNSQVKIVFSYSTISSEKNIGCSFRSGAKTIHNKLLNEISIYVNANLVKCYIVDYQLNKGVYQVAKIDCKALGESLPPLKFVYGNKSDNRGFDKLTSQLSTYFPFSSPSELQVSKASFSQGLFNEGVVIYPNRLANAEFYQHSTAFRHSQDYFKNLYSENQKIIVANGLEDSYVISYDGILAGKGFNGIICCDVDTIPGDEIVKMNEYLGDDGKDYTEITSYVPNLSGGFSPKYSFKHSFNEAHKDAKGNITVYPKLFYAGDFNGDGKNELLVIKPYGLFGSKENACFYLIDLLTGKVIDENEGLFNLNVLYPRYDASNGKEQRNADEASLQSEQLFVYDATGDGKSNLVYIGESGTSTYSFETSHFSHGWKCLSSSTQLSKRDIAGRKTCIANLNEDNLPDIAMAPDYGSTQWKVWLSEGNGEFEKRTMTIPVQYNSESDFFFQDINLDGQSDLVITTPQKTAISVYLTRNCNYANEQLVASKSANELLVPFNAASGRWVSNLLALDTSGVITKYYFQDNDFNSKLLTGYTNSFGVAKEFSYLNLYNSSYIMGTGAHFPFANYNGALLVASGYSVRTKNKQLCHRIFKYDNAVVHKQGLGFCGYENVNVRDEITGYYSNTKYDVYHGGRILELDENNQNLKNEYTYDVTNDKINKSVMSKSILLDKRQNTTTSTTYKYDDKLNVVEVSENFGNGYFRNNVYSYKNQDTGSVYILGQIVSEEHTLIRKDKTASISTEMNYNGSSVISKCDYIAGNLTSTEEYEYNKYGQKTKNSITSFNSSVKKTTSMEYDEKGLLKSRISPDGIMQTFSYDNNNQLIHSEDFKGSIDYTYNGFGALNKIEKSDGTKILYTYNWSNNEAGSVYYELVEETGKPNVIRYYNALGQIVREGTRHYDGNYLFVDKEYDVEGRLVSQTVPFKYTSSSKYVYKYDSGGRLVSEQSPYGEMTTYGYDGLNITTQKNGRSTTKTYNELGDLLSVKSYLGDVSYKYDAFGHVLSATANDMSRKYKYDNFERLIQEKSQAGYLRNKEYDSEGMLCHEDDGENNVRYTYDTLGRIISKKYSEGDAFTYNYNIYGEVLSVTNSTGEVVQKNEYDKYHRLLSTEEKIGKENILKKYYIYENNRVSAIRYETSHGLDVTENYYYANGVLSEVRLNGDKIIWNLKSEDDNGKPTEYSSLGFTTRYSYGDNGQIASIGTYRDGIRLWQEKYKVDATTGNLCSRENTHGVVEIFKYDNQDRLINVNDQKISYDESGTIMDNSVVGAYTYHPAGSDAVATVHTYNNDAISGEEQNITYNMDSKPLSIKEGLHKMILSYGPDGERIETKEYKDDNLVKNKYYFGTKYEVVQANDSLVERLYLMGGAYDAPVVLIHDQSGIKLFHISRDYLGSIKVVCDEKGNIAQELDYDAWGRLVNPKTGTKYGLNDEPSLLLDRGYTGHEYLQMFRLINMNGRLYDPALGQFVSPDPVVADGTNAQCYNGYTYCLNNPLKYNDLNGKNPLVIIGAALVCGWLGGSMVNHNFNPSKWNWNSWGTYFGIVLGGTAGAFGASAYLAGTLELKLALATPFVTVSLYYSTDQNRKGKVRNEITTPMGGYYDSGYIEKAEQNAGEAYDKAVASARSIYNNIINDMSNYAMTDMFSDVFGAACDWGVNNIKSTYNDYMNNFDMKWLGSCTPVPAGTATFNSVDIGRNISRLGGYLGNFYATADTVINVKDTYNSKLEESVKWQTNGAEIGSYVGSVLGSVASGWLSAGTGPAAIAFVAVGSCIGSRVGSYVGRFVGGIAYDVYSVYCIENMVRRQSSYYNIPSYSGY